METLYNKLPNKVKEYLSSDIEDIVRLGVGYVNNNIDALLRFDTKEIKNVKFVFTLHQINNDIISPCNYKLGFSKKIIWGLGADSLLVKDPTRILKLKLNPIK